MCSGFGSVFASGTGENQRNLTAHVVAQRGAPLGRGPAQNLLVQLRQLSCQRELALRQDLGDDRQRFSGPIWRLESDRRPRLLDQRREQPARLAGLTRNVAEKRKTGAAVARDG